MTDDQIANAKEQGLKFLELVRLDTKYEQMALKGQAPAS